jgi:hypothetical protein
MTIQRIVVASAIALLLAASAAVAQTPAPAPTPAPVRVRGTIESVNGQALTVKSRDGTEVAIKLADNAHIIAMVKATLADIQQGGFIAVTAMPQPDGSLKAIGLHIFMDSQRGVVPARFMPWDRAPGSTMTNGDVESTVASVDGQIIMVKYADGEKKVVVSPDTPIVRLVPGNAEDLKSGAQMIVFAAQKMPDGSLTAAAIDVGRDGAAPPM